MWESEPVTGVAIPVADNKGAFLVYLVMDPAVVTAVPPAVVTPGVILAS